MTNFLLVLALGFFLGMRHATDPDHVIAVTTIVSRQRALRQAGLTGLLWGIGHTLTIVCVGAAIILFNVVIPPRLGAGMELSVGLMLIILGAINVVSYFRLRPAAWRRARAERADLADAIGGPRHADADASTAADGHAHPHAHARASSPAPAVVHSHPHSHGDYVHSHPHGHGPEQHPHAPDMTPLAALDRRLGGSRFYALVRPLVIGIVHGLAGSAAVALLVLAAIQDPIWAVAYLLVFGLGTIAGMMLITISLASAFHYAGRGSATFGPRVSLASGLLSVAFGLWLAYEMGTAAGLLPR